MHGSTAGRWVLASYRQIGNHEAAGAHTIESHLLQRPERTGRT